MTFKQLERDCVRLAELSADTFLTVVDSLIALDQRLKNVERFLVKGDMDQQEMASMGGKARAKSLTRARRREIARAAVRARWDARLSQIAEEVPKKSKRKPKGEAA